MNNKLEQQTFLIFREVLELYTLREKDNSFIDNNFKTKMLVHQWFCPVGTIVIVQNNGQYFNHKLSLNEFISLMAQMVLQVIVDILSLCYKAVFYTLPNLNL